MVSVGWLGLHYYGYVQVNGKVIQSIKLFDATVDLCVSVFSTDMNSSSWVQDQVDFCADINYLLSVHATSTIT